MKLLHLKTYECPLQLLNLSFRTSVLQPLVQNPYFRSPISTYMGMSERNLVTVRISSLWYKWMRGKFINPDSRTTGPYRANLSSLDKWYLERSYGPKREQSQSAPKIGKEIGPINKINNMKINSLLSVTESPMLSQYVLKPRIKIGNLDGN